MSRTQHSATKQKPFLQLPIHGFAPEFRAQTFQAAKGTPNSDEVEEVEGPRSHPFACMSPSAQTGSTYCGRGSSNASSLARHSPSMTPSMRSGRKRRWNAMTAF